MDAAPALTLYVAVSADVRRYFESIGKISCHVITPGREYVGLCSCPEDALERHRICMGSASKQECCVLRVSFTHLGVSHYTTHTMGHRSNYSSQLYKTTYHDGVDWQVWHFIGDLPLSERTATGDVLLSTEWLEIS